MEAANVLPGTLDLLILKALSLGSLYGYGILLRIEEISGRALEIEQGALYPALYRLEAAGAVKAVWEPEPHGRRGARRRIYRLTPKGQRQLDAGRVEWQEFVRVLGGILGAPA